MVQDNQSLYRYESFNQYTFNNLIRNQIYLNKAQNFNDPLEFLFNRPISTTLGNKVITIPHLRGILNISKIFSEVDKTERELNLKNYGCYCLSNSKHNLLMWAHYTKGHSGFCLTFDTDFTPFNSALEVTYQEQTPTAPSLLHSIIKNPKLLELKSINKALITKSIHWEYEKEYRILKQLKTTECQAMVYEPEAIQEIYLGCKMSEIFKYTIYKILKKKNPGIKLFNMKLSNTIYDFSTPQEYSPQLTNGFSTDHIDSILKECEHIIYNPEKFDTKPLYEELVRYKQIIDDKRNHLEPEEDEEE